MTLCDLNILPNDFYLVSNRQGVTNAYLPPLIVLNCKPYRTYYEMAKIWSFWPCVTSLFDPFTIWWVAGKVLSIPTYHHNFQRFQSKLQLVEKWQECCYGGDRDGDGDGDRDGTNRAESKVSTFSGYNYHDWIGNM